MTTKTLLKLLAAPLRWLPDWVSNIPALQRHIHTRARDVGVNVAPDAFIHFGATFEGKGGVTVGRGAYVGRGAHLQSSWNWDAREGTRTWMAGDIVLGARSRVESGVHVLPGTQVPHGGHLRSDHDGHRLRQPQANPDKTPLERLSDRTPVFALGTGRSGTQAMAKAVNALPSWTARHEGFPWLNALGAMKARGELTQDELVALMARRWGTFFSPTDLTVDSDQRFYNLLPEVHCVFPQAKFLLVIRPLEKFVASAAAMGWYAEDDRHDHRWSHYRPTPPSIDPPSPGIRNQVQRLVWYWQHVNGAILDFFEEMNPDQTCVVWLGSTEFEQKSAAFCNLDQLHIPPSNTSKHRRLHKFVLGEEELNACAQVQSAFIQRHNLHKPPS